MIIRTSYLLIGISYTGQKVLFLWPAQYVGAGYIHLSVTLLRVSYILGQITHQIDIRFDRYMHHGLTRHNQLLVLLH